MPNNPVTIEGEPYQLRCLSEGGSPDPEIQWTRNGQPLEAEIKWGERKDVATEGLLTINPTIEDHLAIYTCKTWNRAMRDGEKLEKSVTLNVHCKWPATLIKRLTTRNQCVRLIVRL